MYISLLIFLKAGLFIINDNVKNRIKVYKEGYFGPYKVAIGEFYGNLKKENIEIRNHIDDDFYTRILKKISLNPSALKNAEKINISKIMTITDTPLKLPEKVILIYTEKEGLYSIPGYMLKSEGVNLDTINTEYITLLSKEGRIPVILKGLNDGRFDPQDEIIFYAKRLNGNNSYYNLYSFENVYILFFNRDYKVELPKENSEPQNDTLYTEKAYFKLHFEEEKLFPDLDPANSDTEDIWFWKYLEQYREDTTILKLPEADDSLSYILRLNFDTDDVGTSIYTHIIHIKWGNNFIDSFYYESRFPQTIETQIPGYILNSDSLLIIEEKSEVGNYLNWIEIEGEFMLNAKGLDNLKFKIENINTDIEIKGFKSRPEYFININRKNYVNFEIFSYYENGKTLYGLRAKIEETQPSEYFICTNVNLPDSLELYTIEKKIKKETGAEVLIIYHPEFKAYADSLALFHSSSAGGNYTVKTFSVNDIYVQFNNGVKSPFAIRKFLKYFWVNKNPRFNYVILIGDASKDPRNILGDPMKDYIPIFYYPSTFQQFESNAIFTGFYSSDFYYSNIIGDDPFPDVVVSRIPVQNINEMRIIFKKIKDYAQKKAGIWRRHFILATERKTGENSDVYTQINNFLKSLLKKGMTYVEPDENENPENLIRYLSDGCVIFNFIGHGGHHTLWAKGAFRQEDLWETKNYGKYYFFTALSCWTGEFGMWNARSFGEEALLLPQRGAIATISLSGSGKEPGNVNFDISSDYTKSVFIGYLRDSITKIGDLVLYSRFYLLSRHSIEDQFTRTTLKTSNLLGDPLLELPYLNEVKLKTDKNFVLPSDSIRAYVQIPPIYSGTSVWEIIYRNLNDRIIARDLFTKVFDNGNLEIKFKIPDTVQKAKAEVNLYASGGNPLKEITASTDFSVSLLNIDTLYFIPDIFSEDTFRVFVKLSAKNPIKTCELWYSMADSLDPGTMKRITMTEIAGGIFKSDSVLPPFYYDVNHRYFHYAFIASDTFFNTYYTDTFYIQNKTYADITLKKGLINITPGNNLPEINFPYTNSGERDADSFYVFYRIETKSGRFLKSDTFFINSLKTQETKILKIPLPCTTYYRYKIIFDLTNAVREQREIENNGDSGIIYNPYIYVDTSGFKGKLEFNSITFETEFKPSKNLSIYYLKRRKNSEINDSTISIIPIKEEKKNDTIGKFYFANINQTKDIILKTEKDSLWHKIDYIYDSTNNRMEFFLIETGEIGFYNVQDNKGPEIEVFYKNRKIEGNKIRSSKYIDLKLVLKDSSGIDLLFKKPEISINNTSYNYENSIIKKEKSAIINLKQGPFKEGIYSLKITAYDAMGNKTEKNYELEVYVPFDIIYYGNYPNPAKKGKTVIFYELTKPADKMEVKLFTISGRLIKVFKTDDEGLPLNLKGKHKITWNLRDGYGNDVSNGVYFVLLKAERRGEKKKKIGKIAVGQ